MSADFEANLKPMKETNFNAEEPYTKEINQHIPSGFSVYSKFAHGEVKDPMKLYGYEDCVEQFCDYVENEAKRLYHMLKAYEASKTRSMEEIQSSENMPHALKNFRKITPRLEITVITLANTEDLLTGCVI